MKDAETYYVDYLPVGAIVIVKGNVKKIAVMSRGVMTKIAGELVRFDYGGVFYPEGIMGENIIYFNHEDIHKIVHEGYVDEDEILMKENINAWIKKMDIKKGKPYDINMKNLTEKVNNL